MLYVMLYNTYPFNPMPISRGRLQFPSKPRVSEEAQCLIKQILVGPKARIKMADMCRHPWVTTVCQSGSRSAIPYTLLSFNIHDRVHLLWRSSEQGGCQYVHRRDAYACTSSCLQVFCISDGVATHIAPSSDSESRVEHSFHSSCSQMSCQRCIHERRVVHALACL